MKLINIICPSAAVVLAGAIIVSCGKGEEKQAEMIPQESEELPVVDIDVVQAQDVAQTKQYTANVEAFNSNNISPSTMNRIKTINVEVGDHVRKGQVLATLDQSAATQLKVNMDQIEREYNRAVQLLNIGSGTQAMVDQYKAQLDAIKSQYNNLMENTVLTSPVSGVITARNYDPGDMTGQLPILTVGQISPAVKIIINITENDLGAVRTGMPVRVSLDAFPGEEFDGKIARIYPQVDPSSRTFQAEVTVANPSQRFFPGMFARVSLDQGSANRVVVPDRAVVKQTGSGGRYVYVYKNGHVSYNKVEIGRQLGSSYELISGVNPGDTVVIAGQTRLADGVQVQLKNAEKE